MITRKSQFTTEYLIIVGIGIAIITIFLAYVSLYYISFSSSSSTKTLNSAATSLIKQSSYLSSEGSGSETTFSVAFPAINPSQSYFCGNFLKLTSNSITSIQKSSIELNGLLPTTAGTYNFRETNVNGLAKIGLNQPVSYINSSYALSGKTLSYSLYFYNSTGGIGGDITFNITVLSLSGKQISSQTETASNGVYSGSLSLSTTLPEYLVEIFPIGYNVFASSCFTPLVTTFQEEYLTAGSSWSVSFDNQVGTAAIGNEIYISTNNTGGPFTATATVSGLSCSASVLASVGQTITVSDWSCSTSFSESGLLSGMEWWMDYDNNNISTTSSSITMTGNAGTYIYEDKSPIVQGSCTFTASSESGSLPSGGSLPITYSSSCQTTFTESGLPSSTSWWVDYDSSNLSSTGTSITFSTAYAANVGYSVGNGYYGGCKYTPTPSSGTLTTGNSQSISYSTSCAFTFSVPVTITNSRSSATPSPFQQMVNVSSSVYSGHAASNFQNIEFVYQNGTVIPSWLESYTSSNALWWLKLGSLPASSSATVYMGFASTSTNLFNTVNDGEAPTLSEVVQSSTIEYAAPITITNSRSSATPSPFQQMLNISSSVYSSYAASNLQNVEFLYQNGTVVHSWLENYTSNHAIWWIKIGSIPAGGALTIYIGFASESTNLFNNVNIGEAPQLSSTYGEYDDGANVFVAYDNFAGTQLNSSTMGWSGYSGVSVNNGLTFAPCTTSDCSAGINTAQDFSVGSETLDFYGTYATENSGGYSAARMGFLNQNAAGMGGQSGYTATYLSSTSSIENVETNYYSYASTPSIWTIETYGTEVYSFRNYGNEYSETTSELSSDITFFLQQNSGGKYYFNWVRIRNSPPNGVMPSISVGSVTPNIYAEYDDGASVFPALYQNFAGTATPSGWSNTGCTINNGATCPYSSVLQTTATTYGANASAILDYYANFPTPNQDSNPIIGYFASGGFGNNANNGAGFDINTNVCSGLGIIVHNGATNPYTCAGSNFPLNSYAVFSIYSASSSTSGTTLFSTGYGTATSLASGTPTGLVIGISNDGTFGQTLAMYWIRLRAYPPNGVMPSVTFGSGVSP